MTIKAGEKQEFCADCRYAVWESNEPYWGSHLEDCKKSLEPMWNEEEEAYECEGCVLETPRFEDYK